MITSLHQVETKKLLGMNLVFIVVYAYYALSYGSLKKEVCKRKLYKLVLSMCMQKLLV